MLCFDYKSTTCQICVYVLFGLPHLREASNDCMEIHHFVAGFGRQRLAYRVHGRPWWIYNAHMCISYSLAYLKYLNKYVLTTNVSAYVKYVNTFVCVRTIYVS